MSVKNLRTFVIHSRNQILGGFDVDRLCPIFLSSIERTMCSFVKLNPLSSAFVNETYSNVSKKIVVRKSLAPKAEARKAGSANNDADETPRPAISAGRASWVLEILSKFTLHTLESPSSTVLSYFAKRTVWWKHVLVPRKYNNFGSWSFFLTWKTMVRI